jgi:hypothetical protein
MHHLQYRVPLVAMMVEIGVDLLHLRSIDLEIHCDVMGKIVLIPMHVAGSSLVQK